MHPTPALRESTTVESESWPRRVPLFGVKVDAVTMSEATAIVAKWLAGPAPSCRYIVTPNVDHMVLLQEHHGLRAAYADASLVLADGWPVVAAAKLLGRPLPERVPGSDFVPALFGAASTPALRVFLLGAAPGIAERAADRIHARWPTTRIVGTYSPPLGFESCPNENAHIVTLIANAQPDLLVIGLGAPKQELWMHKHRHDIQAKVAICAGATIDFLAGEKQRAPQWMRWMGLEWLHRMITDPRRMVRRYLRDAWIFPRLVWRDWGKLKRTQMT
jgi:N-acetylglucosaminyldiphosphoundecaprenol N-acetyl-beta-D-mannosaminyltransferase